MNAQSSSHIDYSDAALKTPLLLRDAFGIFVSVSPYLNNTLGQQFVPELWKLLIQGTCTHVANTCIWGEGHSMGQCTPSMPLFPL